MKIAVTAQELSVDAPMDPRFGRAKGFVVFDTETGTHECFDNAQNLNAAHGAGTQSAQRVADLGVTCIITGDCGPKALRVLDAAGVKVMIAKNCTVSEAFEDFKADKLSVFDGSY